MKRWVTMLGPLLFCSNPAMARDVASAIDAEVPLARETYAYLHANPELGMQEHKAHAYLLKSLRALGFRRFETSRSAPTAVIAVFDTGRPGETIALRAEMDARPLPEGASEPASHRPRSQVAGVMHSCGHDAHAAILLGTAALIQANPEHFAGKIVFLFQPAEEIAGGADDIVHDGVLARLGVRRIFALHAAPDLPVGTIGLAPGAILAGSNGFKLTLTGRSSHAAAPQDGDDVLLGAMRVAQDISYAPARGFDIVTRPMVVSITGFSGSSGASNVLPAKVEMSGTIRSFENPTQAAAGQLTLEAQLAKRIARSSAGQGLAAKFVLTPGSPPTTNDPALFASLQPRLAERFAGRIDTASSRGMFAEDFAFYTQQIPALYASLGVAKERLGHGALHSADFTIHPDSLAVGIQLMARFAEFGTTGNIAWK